MTQRPQKSEVHIMSPPGLPPCCMPVNKLGIGRGVARGGAESPPGIWQISKPYSNQRGQIMPPHTTASPPGFKKLSTSLFSAYLDTILKALVKQFGVEMSAFEAWG